LQRSVDQEAELVSHSAYAECGERQAHAVSHGTNRSGGLDCLTVTTIAAYGSSFF